MHDVAVFETVSKDFEKFCAKKGCANLADPDWMEISTAETRSDITISFRHGDCYEPIQAVKSYLKKLKSQFSFVKNEEGDDVTTRITIPANKAEEFVNVLSGTTLAAKFNTVVFTGTLSVSRNQAAADAEKRGFKVADSVSKGVDYVVAGDKAGSKVDKAKKLNIPVLTEAEWKKISR